MAVVVSFVGKWDGKDLDKAQRELAKMGDSAKESGHKMATFGKVAGLAALGAAAGVAAFAVSSVKAAQDSVVADARLDNIAKSMHLVNGAYKGGTDRLKDYASELSKQIGVEDESIKAVQSKLLTFKAVGKTINETGGAMDRATKAAYDLASAGFGSAESNATQLGKALQDPIKGVASLARSGVTFTQAEKDKMKALVASGEAGKAQEMILKAVETQVGNTAAKTATASDKMKVSFGELQEKVGNALLPVLNKVADTLGPMFDKLQGPLGKVAEALGGALSAAFDKLAPVLPVIAEAVGKIAGVLGEVLATAIEALVPIITPLVTIIGELASKIGPILAPVLEKIGTLLGAVLAAVMPLIAPLSEVILGILDAAAPILGVVVDALIILVQALAPVLGAVAQLIKPLGTLIMVLLSALLPIIKPLLPVIEALAAVLGDVLTRAVGLIMTGIGYLIQGLAKLAPFVLNNVTKPVVEAFLTMAENVVGAAADMLGWVPGLGDKLNQAKDAIGKFKVNATKAIGEAADTIGTEGAKIGKNLVDQGIGMVTDPANSTKVQNAGLAVGGDLASGMAQGIANGQIPIQAAASNAVKKAAAAARKAADSRSPSKVFAKIGKELTDGLTVGIEQGERTAVVAMRKLLTNVLAQAKNVSKMNKAQLQSFIDSATNVKDAAQARLDQLRDYFNRMKDIVTSSFDKLKDVAQGRIDDLGSKLDDLKSQAKDFGQSIRDSFKVAFGGPEEGGSILGKFAKDIQQARGFVDQIKQLRGMGLNSESLSNIMGAGAENGSKIAEELLKGGAPAVNEVNDLVAMLNNEAGVLADTMRDNQYAAQIADAAAALAQAQASYAAIDAEEKRQLQALNDLAVSFGLQVDPMQLALDNAQGNIENLLSNQQTSTDLLTTSVTEVTTGLLATAASMAKEAKKLGKKLDALDAGIASAQARLDALNAPKAKGAKASGGPITSGTWLVGEAGPELVTVGASGFVTPNNALGGGNTYNITVQAGVGDPRQIGQEVVQYIKRFEQANGPVFASA